MGTIITTVILVLIVTAIVVKMIRDKKRGKSSCGCGCETCGSCTACNHTGEH